MVPKTQHLDALTRNEFVTFFIMRMLAGKTVATTVQFNRKLRQRAIEIQEVDATSILAAKFKLAKTTVAQQTPEPLFSPGRALA